jgi:hypothetical protein
MKRYQRHQEHLKNKKINKIVIEIEINTKEIKIIDRK